VDPDGAFDADTPGGGSGFDDDEPAELDDDDMDPINSGAVTPAVPVVPEKRSKALNFLKKKETKVRRGVLMWWRREAEPLEDYTDDQGSDVHYPQ
jgi:hypothetical protein